MNRRNGLLLILASLCFTWGCAFFSMGPAKAQLEVREMQTRAYATSNTKMVMKAMLNVLQDEGYVVKQADSDLGLLAATKETDLGGGGWNLFFSDKSKKGRRQKTSILECTANVSEYGKGSRVRVTFSKKILDNKGDVMQIQQVNDSSFYRDFFSKVDKGVFIQKERI